MSGVDTLAIHVEMALQRFKVLLSGEVSDDEQSTYRITYLHVSVPNNHMSGTTTVLPPWVEQPSTEQCVLQ